MWKNHPGKDGFFGILTTFHPVSPFMIAHIVKALQVFLHSVWIQDVYWTERRASATDQGKSDRWRVKASIRTCESTIKPPVRAARRDKRKRNNWLVLWDSDGGVKLNSQRRAVRNKGRNPYFWKRPNRYWISLKSSRNLVGVGAAEISKFRGA